MVSNYLQYFLKRKIFCDFYRLLLPQIPSWGFYLKWNNKERLSVYKNLSSVCSYKKGSEIFWHIPANIEQALRKFFFLNKSCGDGECLVYTWIFYAIKYCIQGLPGHAHISKWLKWLQSYAFTIFCEEEEDKKEKDKRHPQNGITQSLEWKWSTPVDQLDDSFSDSYQLRQPPGESWRI